MFTKKEAKILKAFFENSDNYFRSCSIPASSGYLYIEDILEVERQSSRLPGEIEPLISLSIYSYFEYCSDGTVIDSYLAAVNKIIGLLEEDLGKKISITEEDKELLSCILGMQYAERYFILLTPEEKERYSQSISKYNRKKRSVKKAPHKEKELTESDAAYWPFDRLP